MKTTVFLTNVILVTRAGVDHAPQTAAVLEVDILETRVVKAALEADIPETRVVKVVREADQDPRQEVDPDQDLDPEVAGVVLAQDLNRIRGIATKTITGVTVTLTIMIIIDQITKEVRQGIS